MRVVFAISILVLGFAAPAFATDEFGARFTDTSPSAFEDPAEDSTVTELSMEEAAELLQTILPAAGDEEPAEGYEGPVMNEIGEPIAE